MKLHCKVLPQKLAFLNFLFTRLDRFHTSKQKSHNLVVGDVYTNTRHMNKHEADTTE